MQAISHQTTKKIQHLGKHYGFDIINHIILITNSNKYENLQCQRNSTDSSVWHCYIQKQKIGVQHCHVDTDESFKHKQMFLSPVVEVFGNSWYVEKWTFLVIKKTTLHATDYVDLQTPQLIYKSYQHGVLPLARELYSNYTKKKQSTNWCCLTDMDALDGKSLSYKHAHMIESHPKFQDFWTLSLKENLRKD